MSVQFQEEELIEVLDDQGTEDGKVLIVYNDDFNTFDHVINTLIKVCKHDQTATNGDHGCRHQRSNHMTYY